MPAKRSRKTSDAEQAAKRKKNAEAQAQFRQRRAAYIADLESTVDSLTKAVTELRELCSSANEETTFYRGKATTLEKIVSELQSRLLPPPSPPSPPPSSYPSSATCESSPLLLAPLYLPPVPPSVPPPYDVLHDGDLQSYFPQTSPSPWTVPGGEADHHAPYAAGFTPACSIHKPFVNVSEAYLLPPPVPNRFVEPAHLLAHRAHPTSSSRTFFATSPFDDSDLSSISSCDSPPSSPPPPAPAPLPFVASQKAGPSQPQQPQPYRRDPHRIHSLPVRAARCEDALRLAQGALRDTRDEQAGHARFRAQQWRPLGILSAPL